MRKNISILSTDFSKDNGGIQNWMYYTKKLLNDSLGGVNSYSYKQDSFYKYLKSLMSDVFFLSTWKQVIFILPSCLTGTKKIFVFVHGSELLNINSILKYVFVFLLNRRNTYFIANSNAIGELFLKVTDRNIDFVQYPFACYSKLLNFETNDTHSTIGFFSICRLDKRKNIGNTILALKKIMNNKGLKFNYTIAGSGSEHESLERLIKCNNLQDNIRLVGRVSDKEKNTLFMNNDYFLMPAIFDEKGGEIEGFGIVFIEACSYGLPALCGNSGGMVEAVLHNKTGIHCDGSIGDIENKIEDLLRFKFDAQLLRQHASSFDYKKQTEFIRFVKDRLG